MQIYCPANDDGSTGIVPLGFSIDYFGTAYNSIYINNNGNITFSGALPTYTPAAIGNVSVPIIAPFWADVDTLGSGSGIVEYGVGMVDGRNAFGVNWINVGYYNQNTDKLNSFQLVLIDRSDRAAGAFDVEFNYDKVLWETGDDSLGTGGLGGFSARVGYSDGTANDFELSGSGVNGAFLNSNTATGLIHNSRNSTVLGRYVFELPVSARVTKVEYEQINSGTLPVDMNPNAEGGRRIFPDKDSPTDGIDRRKIRVKAKYGETTAGVKIYFRSLDVDDPSADSAPIDVEPTAGVNTGDDNNGTVDGTAATKAGLLSVPSPNPNMCQPWMNASASGISCLTDATGTATVDFTTTRQPGDNFVVVASANETYLSNLTLAADGINLIDTTNIQIPVTVPTPPGVNGCANSTVRACRADMLTVWRRLHIEVDSMGEVTGNNVNGRFTRRTYGSNGINTITLPTSTLEPNRFENGRLVVTTGGFFQPTIYSFKVIDTDLTANPPVNANTANTVTIMNPGGNFTFGIGDEFTLYDDDDFNDDDGFIKDGDTSENVEEKLQTFALMRNSDSVTQNAYAAAYIRPEYDWANSQGYNQHNINFGINLNYDITSQNDLGLLYTFLENNRNSRAEYDDFWSAYIFLVYQPTEMHDNDPITEMNTSGGYTLATSLADTPPPPSDPFPAGGEHSLVFLETCRDVDGEYGTPEFETSTTAHEVGHQMGLKGDVPGFGIMYSGEPLVFVPIHINMLRKRVHSPGN